MRVKNKNSIEVKSLIPLWLFNRASKLYLTALNNPDILAQLDGQFICDDYSMESMINELLIVALETLEIKMEGEEK